ncbi:hypothetical protein [Microbacterium aurum]
MAGLIGIAAILTDLFIEPFRAFAVSHAMTTALISMGIFAVITIGVIDWLARRRERMKRSAVTASAVRVAANLGWAAVSHRSMSWPNLRDSQVAVEAMRAVQAYQTHLTTLALTPNPGTEFYELMAKHDDLSAALDEYLEHPPENNEAEARRVERLLEAQRCVDAASWPYIQRTLPDYWSAAGRFTPPFAEPPPHFQYMPRRPIRRSPDPKHPNQSVTSEGSGANPGSDAVGRVSDDSSYLDDLPF